MWMSHFKTRIKTRIIENRNDKSTWAVNDSSVMHKLSGYLCDFRGNPVTTVVTTDGRNSKIDKERTRILIYEPCHCFLKGFHVSDVSFPNNIYISENTTFTTIQQTNLYLSNHHKKCYTYKQKKIVIIFRNLFWHSTDAKLALLNTRKGTKSSLPLIKNWPSWSSCPDIELCWSIPNQWFGMFEGTRRGCHPQLLVIKSTIVTTSHEVSWAS